VGPSIDERQARRPSRPPKGLTEALKALGFPQPVAQKPDPPPGGTACSVALDQLEEQPSDAKGRYFSFDPKCLGEK